MIVFNDTTVSRLYMNYFRLLFPLLFPLTDWINSFPLQLSLLLNVVDEERRMVVSNCQNLLSHLGNLNFFSGVSLTELRKSLCIECNFVIYECIEFCISDSLEEKSDVKSHCETMRTLFFNAMSSTGL